MKLNNDIANLFNQISNSVNLLNLEDMINLNKEIKTKINAEVEIPTTNKNLMLEMPKNLNELEENIKIILSSFGIYPTEKNLTLAKTLINSNVPLNKEAITKNNLNLKLFSELPFEKLEFLLKNNIEVNELSVNTLEKYIKNEISLDKSILDILSNTDDSNIMEKTLSTLTNKKNIASELKDINFEVENLQSVIKNNILNKSNINLLEKNFKILKNNKDILQNLFFNNDDIKNIENSIQIFNKINNTENISPENIKKIAQKLFDNNLFNFLLPEKTLINSKENLKEVIATEIAKVVLPHNLIFNKKSINTLKDFINDEPKNILKNSEKFILNEIFKEIINTSDKKMIKNFVDNSLKFQDNVLKDISIDLEKSTVKDVSNFFNNIKKIIKINNNVENKSILKKINEFENKSENSIENEILVDAKKLINTNDFKSENTLTKILQDVESTLDFMNSMKDTLFLQIPININNNVTNTELYIFKDKNNKNKGNKNSKSGSALISLNLCNLGKLESLIKKVDNDIYCQFKLEKIFTKELIQKNTELLRNYLKEKKLILKEITFKNFDEKFSLFNKQNFENNIIVNNFDIKA